MPNAPNVAAPTAWAPLALPTLGLSIEVRGLTRAESVAAKTRCVQPDGSLDVFAFECEQLHIGARSGGKSPTLEQAREFAACHRAGTWRLIIDAIDAASEDQFRRPRVSGVSFMVAEVIASAAKRRHYATPPRSVSAAPPRTAARARGAGRPRAQATRSSAKSGDSPSDDGDSEPDAASPAAREAVAVVWETILRRRTPGIAWEVVSK
jgi:hypothetical protein